jgi:hypothetical protein
VPHISKLYSPADAAAYFVQPSLIMPFTTGEGVLLKIDSKGFDWSFQFEQLFFSIIPSALFIIASSWRTISQTCKPKMVHAPTFQYIKLVCTAFYPQIASSHFV